jgi:hypothetical protein
MSGAYTITITPKGEAAERFKKFGNSPGLSRVVGEAAEGVVKGHFFKLDGERANKLGGKRSHFYWQAAKGTTHQALPDGAVVKVSKLGIRQRWKGGTIRAINVKYLTIPARSESYNVRARQFPKTLRFIKFKSGAAALVIDERTSAGQQKKQFLAGKKVTRRNKSLKTAGQVVYWLVPSVYQRPDPSVLPPPSEMTKAVTEAASKYLLSFV